MILYHYPTSPFSRRVRLVLCSKGISAELRDARASAEHKREVERLNPLHTVPVLVDGEHVVTDSVAIAHYLDRKVPTPALWPPGQPGAEAFQLVAWTDGALNLIIDLGARYHALQGDPNYPAIREQMVGRAQRALDLLAERVQRSPPGAPLCGDAWSGADMAVFTAVEWLEGVAVRALTQPLAKQVVGLGWSLPAALRRWADPHRKREDVVGPV